MNHGLRTGWTQSCYSAQRLLIASGLEGNDVRTSSGFYFLGVNKA